jgi:hypothetical protein
MNRAIPLPPPVEPLPETLPTNSNIPPPTTVELPRVDVPDPALVPPPRVKLPRRPHTVSPERTPLTTPTHALHHMHHPLTGTKETFETLRRDNPTRWNHSMANELGRLTSGVGDRMKTGNENIFYINKSQVPQGRKVTYANAVCDYRPLKDEPYRVRFTVGGDRLPYPADAGAPAATILEAKLLFNSVISTPKAKFMTADILDYFLCTPMDRYEYIKIHYRMIPEEIRQQYHLADLVDPDGYVYFEVRKGMYGLKQASAHLAFDNLVRKLSPHGYYPI